MKIRFGLGVMAYLAPTFALGFVWRLMLFNAYYERLAIYRQDIIIPFGFLSMLMQAFLFAWVYQRAFAERNARLCTCATESNGRRITSWRFSKPPPEPENGARSVGWP